MGGSRWVKIMGFTSSFKKFYHICQHSLSHHKKFLTSVELVWPVYDCFCQLQGNVVLLESTSLEGRRYLVCRTLLPEPVKLIQAQIQPLGQPLRHTDPRLLLPTQY